MKDYIVRASAANAQIRAFAAVTTELTEEARKRQDKSCRNGGSRKTAHRRSNDGKHDEK